MNLWLDLAAATFLDFAGILSLMRWAKTKNGGLLFLGVAVFAASAVFYYLAVTKFQSAQ